MSEPQATKIMIIRHGEKPDGISQGVTEDGVPSKHDLIVRGWQRAGALACFFATDGSSNQSIATPQFLFASAASDGADASDVTETKSNRPKSTLLPLSRRLNLQIDTSLTKGQEIALAAAVQNCPGTVLIAWQHEAINTLVSALPGSHPTLPAKWPSNRFDMVYVLNLQPASGQYQFTQVPELLLDSDSDSLFV